MNNLKIGIVAVAYNRLDSISRLLESLDRASYPEDVTLIISIDKSNTDVVEKFAFQYDWKHGAKQVITHEENLGLRNHMLSLGQHFSEFDALIILEDDISVSPSFYLYAKECVNKYHTNKDVAGISLYAPNMSYISLHPFMPSYTKYDAYFIKSAFSWGEVWMKEQWLDFQRWYSMNSGDIPNLPSIPKPLTLWSKKSWLKYHMTYCLQENKYFVVPYVSMSTNNADIGTHQSVINCSNQVALQNDIKTDYLLPDNISDSVHYDEFYEDERLFDVLSLSDQELNLNLMCSRHVLIDKRYILTPLVLNYKIIKQFGLQRKPINENVYYENQGSGIYLYDTTKPENNPYDTRIRFNEYLMPYSVTLLRRISGVRNLLWFYVKKMIKRL